MKTKLLAAVLLFAPAAAIAQTAEPAKAPPADPRAAAIEICMAEARNRAKQMGATDAHMRVVKDTDKKSEGRVAVRAEIEVITTDSKGKAKSKKEQFKCEVRGATVTQFEFH